MDEKFKAFERALQKLHYDSKSSLASVAFEKYLSLHGTFSYCGATGLRLELETKDDLLIDCIAYSLGMPFLKSKSD